MRTCLALSLFDFLPARAWSYEAVAVQGGGTIRGTINLQGTPPKVAEVTFSNDLSPQDRAYCSGKQPLAVPFYATDGARHLKDVVVWLDGIQKGKAPPAEVRRLSNTNCRFVPLVQTMTVGEYLQVENHDPILHNTHPIFLGDQSTLFNVALPEQGQKVKKKVRRPGVVKVQCDAGHVWMRAFVHVFDHPYHAVTGADGTYVLADVPPGKYTLKVWHEGAGLLSQEIEVASGAQVVKDFTVEAK